MEEGSEMNGTSVLRSSLTKFAIVLAIVVAVFGAYFAVSAPSQEAEARVYHRCGYRPVTITAYDEQGMVADTHTLFVYSCWSTPGAVIQY